MAIVGVTHGTESQEAAALLASFYRVAGQRLGRSVVGRTIDRLGELSPKDRVYGLFFTNGGHVRRDLLPVVSRSGARFMGTIPSQITANCAQRALMENSIRPGTPIVIVSPRSKFAPREKAESMDAICRSLRAQGHPASAAYYDEVESLLLVRERTGARVAFLLTLLPGYTLEKAPPVLQRHGFQVVSGAWLPRMEPELIEWFRSTTEPSSTPT